MSTVQGIHAGNIITRSCLRILASQKFYYKRRCCRPKLTQNTCLVTRCAVRIDKQLDSASYNAFILGSLASVRVLKSANHCPCAIRYDRIIINCKYASLRSKLRLKMRRKTHKTCRGHICALT